MIIIAQENHESCTINFIFEDVPELVTLNIRNQAFKLNYLKPVYQVSTIILYYRPYLCLGNILRYTRI